MELRCSKLRRPLLSHNLFQPPASVREIADRLYIGKNAVQAHLSNLYDKFGIYDEGADGGRRVILANDAMQRGGRHHRRPRRPSSRRRRRAWLTTGSSARGTRCCER